MKEVAVIGGYGTFGRLVAQELARLGCCLTIAGRNSEKARIQARNLGAEHGSAAFDSRCETDCRELAASHRVLVNCAGPFSETGKRLVAACIGAQRHYVDIADGRDFCAYVRSCHEQLCKHGVTAVSGCSSLPGISGALALHAKELLSGSVNSVRATLFIGNRNRKGLAAVRSAFSIVGKRIQTSPESITGLADPVRIDLPPPFGRRLCGNFESPEYDLLPPLLGVKKIVVKVGFEAPLLIPILARLAGSAHRPGNATTSILMQLGRLTSWLGHSGGAVMLEALSENGSGCTVAISGSKEGQRMAPFLTARWRNILLLTYVIPPERLVLRLPPGVELDTRNSQAFVSLVSLDFEDTRVLGLPWPGFRRFPDLNLRIYVRRGDQRGVVFVREIVTSRLLAWAARTVYREPFLSARLESTQREQTDRVVVERRLHFGGRVHTIRGEGGKPPFLPAEDSDEHFFKERYWGFGLDRRGRTTCYRVEHPIWEVYPVQSCSLDLDWEQVYGPDWAFLHNNAPYSVALAVGSQVAVYWM